MGNQEGRRVSILDDKDSRHSYMAKHLRMTIAFQVRLIRIQRGWTQAQLARRCGTKQPAIARIEDWDAEFPNIETLRKVASAFDCALMIHFDGWEELIATLVLPRVEDLQVNRETKERND
jgi:transcriptional regulator with XRE-family HTH domain